MYRSSDDDGRISSNKVHVNESVFFYFFRKMQAVSCEMSITAAFVKIIIAIEQL